jgi:hypothetical protein
MLIFLSLFGCEGFGRTAEIGEQFTLKTKESSKVRGTGIEITLNQIGRKWLANGGGETLDLSFSVKHNGSVKTYTESSPDPITAGKYKIEVVKTEPFGEGYAIFVVNKNETAENKTDDAAAKFVEQFGWHIDESISPTKIALEFPNNFDGLPFNHYESASQRSGVDMSSLLGKTIEMLKYTLREKQNDREKDFEIFAHLIIENGKVVGAWRTDSSSRAPGIYSFVKK